MASGEKVSKAFQKLCVLLYLFFPLAPLHHTLQLLIRYWLTRVIMTRTWHCQHFNTLFHYILDILCSQQTDPAAFRWYYLGLFVRCDKFGRHAHPLPFMHPLCTRLSALSGLFHNSSQSQPTHTGPYLAWLTLYQARDLTISIAQLLATSSFYTRLVIIYSSVSFIVLYILFETLFSLKGLWDYCQEL